MERQHFDISLNGAVVATTFAWNSAIRKIERFLLSTATNIDRSSTHETLRYNIELRGSIPTC